MGLCVQRLVLAFVVLCIASWFPLCQAFDVSPNQFISHGKRYYVYSSDVVPYLGDVDQDTNNERPYAMDIDGEKSLEPKADISIDQNVPLAGDKDYRLYIEEPFRQDGGDIVFVSDSDDFQTNIDNAINNNIFNNNNNNDNNSEQRVDQVDEDDDDDIDVGGNNFIYLPVEINDDDDDEFYESSDSLQGSAKICPGCASVGTGNREAVANGNPNTDSMNYYLQRDARGGKRRRDHKSFRLFSKKQGTEKTYTAIWQKLKQGLKDWSFNKRSKSKEMYPCNDFVNKHVGLRLFGIDCYEIESIDKGDRPLNKVLGYQADKYTPDKEERMAISYLNPGNSAIQDVHDKLISSLLNILKRSYNKLSKILEVDMSKSDLETDLNPDGDIDLDFNGEDLSHFSAPFVNVIKVQREAQPESRASTPFTMEEMERHYEPETSLQQPEGLMSLQVHKKAGQRS